MAPARRMTRSNREVYPIMFFPTPPSAPLNRLCDNKRINQWSLFKETDWLISKSITARSCSSSFVRIEQDVISFCSLISSALRLVFNLSSTRRLFFNVLQWDSILMQLLFSVLIELVVLMLSDRRLLSTLFSSLQSCLPSSMPSFNLYDLIFNYLIEFVDFSI
jgi:hypothetical protein